MLLTPNFFLSLQSCLQDALLLLLLLKTSPLLCELSICHLKPSLTQKLRRPRGRPSAKGKAKKSNEFIDDEAEETFVYLPYV